MSKEVDSFSWRLTKAAPKEITKIEGKALSSYISKQEETWLKKLHQAPKNQKVLFIEEETLSNKLVVCLSSDEKRVDTFILVKNLYSPEKKKNPYKQIFHVIHFRTAKSYALMLLDLESEKGRFYGMREANIIKKWSGTKGLVQTFRILPFVLEGKHILCIQDYFPDGDLKSAHLEGWLEKKDLFQITFDLLQTLHNLHSKNWMVFDVRPDNVLLARIPQGERVITRATLCDFAKMTEIKDKFRRGVKMYNSWDAPEVHRYFCLGEKGNEYIGPPADIWALGVHLRAIFFTKSPPWMSVKGKRRKYIAMRDPSAFPEPGNSNSLEHLFWEMQRPVPTERITAKEAIKKLIQLAKTEQIALVK